jgi:hypothetical protein
MSSGPGRLSLLLVFVAPFPGHGEAGWPTPAPAKPTPFVPFRLTPAPTPGPDICPTLQGCKQCSGNHKCAFCIDDLSSGHCASGACHSLAHGASAWVPRSCHSKQYDCIKVFAKLFPGKTMEDEGPCKAVMTSNFMPGSCVGNAKHCSELAADMLDVCVGSLWPDIPKDNNRHKGTSRHPPTYCITHIRSMPQFLYPRETFYNGASRWNEKSI